VRIVTTVHQIRPPTKYCEADQTSVRYIDGQDYGLGLFYSKGGRLQLYHGKGQTFRQVVLTKEQVLALLPALQDYATSED
jgi:hypothetical protein